MGFDLTTEFTGLLWLVTNDFNTHQFIQSVNSLWHTLPSQLMSSLVVIRLQLLNMESPLQLWSWNRLRNFLFSCTSSQSWFQVPSGPMTIVLFLPKHLGVLKSGLLFDERRGLTTSNWLEQALTAHCIAALSCRYIWTATKTQPAGLVTSDTLLLAFASSRSWLLAMQDAWPYPCQTTFSHLTSVSMVG